MCGVQRILLTIECDFSIKLSFICTQLMFEHVQMAYSYRARLLVHGKSSFLFVLKMPSITIHTPLLPSSAQHIVLYNCRQYELDEECGAGGGAALGTQAHRGGRGARSQGGN